MGRKKSYSNDFKEMIVELKLHGSTYDDIESEYGVSKASIANWVKELKNKVSEHSSNDLKELDNSTIEMMNKEELSKLLLETRKELSKAKKTINDKEKEIKNTKEEAEILKKAITIFTKKDL